MSLRIRRGLDADRIGIVFEEGEIIYATDTKKTYTGDGLTAGGVEIGGDGQVHSIIAGENVTVDSTDPVNPEVSVDQALFDAKANATDLTDHTSDATIHFLQTEIDHVNLLNTGTNTHSDIDLHIADTNIHFTEASIDKYTQGQVNTLLGGKENLLDAVTNDGLALIGYENGNRNWEMVVKSHSDQTDYVIDDIVNYFGHFYTCIVNHTAQAFDPDQWKVTVNPIGFGIQMTYDWNGSALSGDPGSGFMGTNNVDPSLATTLYISDVTEPGNIGEFVWIAAQVGDVIGYEEVAKDHENAYFRVTGSAIDGVAYTQIPVEYIAGTGTPDNNKKGIASYTNDPANRMPSGGLTDQSLVKTTDGDYDTAWEYRLSNAVNVGAGVGVVRDIVGTAANLRTLVGGANVTLDAVTNPDEVAIASQDTVYDDTALQAEVDGKVTTEQEGGVGIVVGNMIQMTQSQYDALGGSAQTDTFYIIVGV